MVKEPSKPGRGKEAPKTEPPVTIGHPEPPHPESVRQLLDGAIRLFQRAGFEVDIEDSYRSFPADLKVTHREVHHERRYLVEVKMELTAEHSDRLLAKYEHLIRSQHQFHSQGYRELWVITADEPSFKPEGPAPWGAGIKIMDLGELAKTLEPYTPAPPLPPTAREISADDKVKTSIGKAILTNDRDIQLAIAVLESLIDEKLDILNLQLPNSVEGIAEQKAELLEYNRLKA
jgi:hypothetical protein